MSATLRDTDKPNLYHSTVRQRQKGLSNLSNGCREYMVCTPSCSFQITACYLCCKKEISNIAISKVFIFFHQANDEKMIVIYYVLTTFEMGSKAEKS